MQYVYGLFDPRNNHLRYIGRTNNPKTRLKAHCENRFAGKRKNLWIDDVQASGLQPILEILEEAEGANIMEAENFYIDYFRMLGAELTNNHQDKPREIISKEKDPTILLQLDVEFLGLIDQAAKKRRLTRLGLIRQALLDYLEKL